MKKFTLSVAVLAYLVAIGILLAAIIEVPVVDSRMNVMILGGGTPATTTAASCSTSNDVELEPDQSQAHVNGVNNDSVNDWTATSFTHSSNFTATGVFLELQDQVGAGNITITLQGDTGASDYDPDGSDIAGTSVTLGHADIPPSFGMVWFEFATPVTGFSASTRYHIVMKLDASAEVSHGKDTANDYANGSAKATSNAGSSWVEWATNDFLFEVWGCTE